MRGFIVSLDSVIAIMFLMFALMILTGQTYNPSSPGDVYLKQLTLDAMTVMEKTGRLDGALSGNTSAIPEIIEATPNLACMQVSITNSTNSLVLMVVKSNCTETSNLDMQTASRPLLYQGGMYTVTAESWFRKEPD